MPDYGHDLLFGVFVPPLAQQADAGARAGTARGRGGA